MYTDIKRYFRSKEAAEELSFTVQWARTVQGAAAPDTNTLWRRIMQAFHHHTYCCKYIILSFGWLKTLKKRTLKKFTFKIGSINTITKPKLTKNWPFMYHSLNFRSTVWCLLNKFRSNGSEPTCSLKRLRLLRKSNDCSITFPTKHRPESRWGVQEGDMASASYCPGNKTVRSGQ